MATQMQKLATAKIVEAVENGRKISVSGVMREVGYSPVTATHPDKLLDSIGAKEELAKYGLTEERYKTKINEALEAKKWNDFTGEREPDYKTQLPYHTKLGKLLGLESEAANQTLNQTNNNLTISMSDEAIKDTVFLWVKTHAEAHSELKALIAKTALSP